MKLRVSKKELNECISNAISRVLNESKTKKDGFIKATKKANRDIERDTMGDGFKSYNKVHKSQKEYSRKGKNNSWRNFEELDEAAIDFTVPGDEEFDDGYDMSEIPDLNDVVDYEQGYSEINSDNIPSVTLRTDINEVEKDLINDILSEFEDADYDVVEGAVSFTIPKTLKGKFIGFLKDNDVEILRKK